MTAEDGSGSAEGALTVAACPVCSRLQDVERAYHKWGWDEVTLSFPDAVRHLEPMPAGVDAGQENGIGGETSGETLLRCPHCGTPYRYTWSSEYLANGSEDREELKRLAPAQARQDLPEGEYERLMSLAGLWLFHANGAVRRQAARSLLGHHLAAGDAAIVRPLLAAEDEEILRGALFLMRDLYREGREALDLAPLTGALETLQHHRDGEIAGAAQYLLSAAHAGTRR